MSQPQQQGRVIDLPCGKVESAERRLRQELGEDGARVYLQINRDPAFCRRLARFATAGGSRLTTSQKLAHEIMGKNFFGFDEINRYFGNSISRDELVALATVPFSSRALRKRANTHVLVADIGTSIADVHKKVPVTLHLREEDTQPLARSFIDAREWPQWRLIRKTPVGGSFSRTWQERRAFLGKNDEIPSARVMIYMIIGHYLATKEQLFKDAFVCTSDPLGGRGHIASRVVGGFDVQLQLVSYADQYISNSPNIGLASARQPC